MNFNCNNESLYSDLNEHNSPRNNLDYIHALECYKTKLNDVSNCNHKLEAEILDIKEEHKLEIKKLNEDVQRHKSKYERLYDSHRRVSKLNHDLEEKILQNIEASNEIKAKEDDKTNELSKEISHLNDYIKTLEEKLEMYRRDCLIAVQLLQNNPDNYLSRHIKTLPVNLKERLRDLENGMYNTNNRRQENLHDNEDDSNPPPPYIPPHISSTFPPTALYMPAVEKSSHDLDDQVDPSLLATLLNPTTTANISPSNTSHVSYCSNCRESVSVKDGITQTFLIRSSVAPSNKQKVGVRNRVFDV